MIEPPVRLVSALEDRYRIERELGQGGMATVYLADDLKHQRRIAIKVLRPEFAAAVGAKRFMAEIRTTASLRHPHILPLFDSGQVGDQVFYAMPYVDGQSLRERLDRERQLPVDEAVRIARIVSSALAHAHKQGVVHRDIKPGNILFQDGEPIVADFGIARAVRGVGVERLTDTGLSLGTPCYMSPEQASGDAHVDARSDVYALGAVLYEMLIGEPPFDGPTPLSVLAKVLTKPAPNVRDLRPELPRHVASAIARALERVPADRFPTAEAFGEALESHVSRDGAIIADHVSQLNAADLPSRFSPLKSLDVFPNNLPLQLTSFVGREREMEIVKQGLAKGRLLTLTGPGGTGKTRLSLQVAADLLDTFSDGVWLVELADLTDPQLVPQAVATVLGIRGRPGQTLLTTLTAHLRDKHVLLVLDNCEHLVAVSAELAEAVLRVCPKVRLLASSREALGIGGESVFPVPPLSLPDAAHLTPLKTLTQHEAVRLFTDRAMSVVPSFSVTSQTAPAVSQICHRLDGIPLAIELAAARVKVLSVEQIAARLDDRFQLLTGGSRTAQPRQQTLRAAIDWSYGLLSEPEKVLLRRLAVFVDGWTMDAAEVVCADEVSGANSDHSVHSDKILDLMTQLIDKSLVLVEQGEQSRYRLLETIRQYALEKLSDPAEEAGGVETARDRHADYFAALAQELAPTWGATIEGRRVELDNFRAALAWLRSRGSGELELRVAISLFDLWIIGGYPSEGRRAVEGALRSPAGHPADLRAKALKAAGDLALDEGDWAAANELLEQAKRRYCEIGDEPNVARCMTDLGHVAKGVQDHGRAEILFAESIRLARDLDDASVLADALLNYGDFLVSKGEFVRAEIVCRESLALHQERGSCLGIATCLFSLALACLHQGRQDEAFGRLHECLGIFRDFDYAVGIANSFEGLAAIAALRGRGEKAARLLGAAEVLFERVGTSLEPAEHALHERTLVRIRGELGDTALERLWTDGRALSLGKAIEYALDRID